jgi:inner membrane protein
MPLPIAHGLLGASIVTAIHPKPMNRYFLPLFIGVFLANAADFDFAFVFTFGSGELHRGFSHSIFFALLICLIFTFSFGRNYFREAVSYGLAYTSHCFLDFVTTKEGGGLELLFPFSTNRLGLGWFGLSELPSQLSAIEILKAIALETLIFVPLFIFILLIRKFAAKKEFKTL